MPSASQPASRRPASQAQNKLVLSTLGLSGPLWASLVQDSLAVHLLSLLIR